MKSLQNTAMVLGFIQVVWLQENVPALLQTAVQERATNH